MNIDEFRVYYLSKPNATESMPYHTETLAFWIDGKEFALTRLDKPFMFNVKNTPEKVAMLKEQYSFVLPAYHMNKVHWVSVVVDESTPDKILMELIDESYDLVRKKKSQE